MDSGSKKAELARLLDISRAYKVSKCLNLAGKLGVFTICAAAEPTGLTCSELSSSLGFCNDPGFRGAADFFDLLTSIRTLQRTGDGPGAHYTVHPDAKQFLCEGSEDYMGGILALNNDRSSVLFSHLEEALRDGQVSSAVVPDITQTFSKAGDQAGGAGHFALGMLGASIGNFQELARIFDFSRYQSIVDIGGSTGCACVALCQRHPHLSKAATCDLPAVRPMAEAYVARHGMQERVKVIDMDFFRDPFPAADVVVMGMILHDWGLEKKKGLLRRAYDALPNGGACICVDNLIDNDRRQATASLAMSLDMLCEFGRENSFDYTFNEFKSWAREVGFSHTEEAPLPLVGSTAAAVAYK